MPIKARIGTVVSNKMQKTIVVAVKNNYKSTQFYFICKKCKLFNLENFINNEI